MRALYLFLAISCLLPAQELNVSAREKSLVQIVVRKLDGSITPFGTGFFIRENTLIATALHVFNQATLLIADSRGGQVLVRRADRKLGKYVYSTVEAEKVDPTHDLVILKMISVDTTVWAEFGGMPALELSDIKTVEIGRPLSMLGYFSNDLYPVAIRGDLAGETVMASPTIQIPEFLASLFAFPGQSGSPVLTDDDRVIGVMIAVIPSPVPFLNSIQPIHSGLSRVTKVQHLKALLATVQPASPPQAPVKAAPAKP